MKRFDNIILIISALFIGAMSVSACPDEEITEELADNFTRENPEIDLGEENLLDSINLADYPFLNLNANKIILNGADWS
ncbi:MAG: hypothetical protein K2J10_01990, partial [Muribaculaceae bacterium]|nr:hypothetical protein [Muribaculaceae bacterium]